MLPGWLPDWPPGCLATWLHALHSGFAQYVHGTLSGSKLDSNMRGPPRERGSEARA